MSCLFSPSVPPPWMYLLLLWGDIQKWFYFKCPQLASRVCKTEIELGTLLDVMLQIKDSVTQLTFNKFKNFLFASRFAVESWYLCSSCRCPNTPRIRHPSATVPYMISYLVSNYVFTKLWKWLMSIILTILVYVSWRRRLYRKLSFPSLSLRVSHSLIPESYKDCNNSFRETTQG